MLPPHLRCRARFNPDFNWIDLNAAARHTADINAFKYTIIFHDFDAELIRPLLIIVKKVAIIQLFLFQIAFHKKDITENFARLGMTYTDSVGRILTPALERNFHGIRRFHFELLRQLIRKSSD
ncbi:hypothetical protein V6L77_05325 [Pannonibacter sp. Pt2-lr]